MVFFPIWDRNPLRVIPFQYVTVGVIVVTAAIFITLKFLPVAEAGRLMLGFSLIPAVLFEHIALRPEFQLVPAELTLITALFIHGTWIHLISNLLFLWVFGDNVEDAMGSWRYALFFLLCGVIANMVHALSLPLSLSPTIGMSGAISGLLGGYLMLHPRVKVLALAFAFFPVYLPAYVLIGAWIALQIVWAIVPNPAHAGIALWAHIGGFVAGMVLVVVFKRRDQPLFDGSRKPKGRRPREGRWRRLLPW